MPDVNEFDMCAHLETAILEYFDGTLSESDRGRLELHLMNCAGCQAFWEEQRKLDETLMASLRSPALPVHFKNRMLELARADLLSGMAIASNSSRYRKNEPEWMLTSLRRSVLHGAAFSFLDGLGTLIIAALTIMACRELLMHSASLSHFSSLQIGFGVAAAAGLGSLLGGVWLGFREKLRALFEET